MTRDLLLSAGADQAGRQRPPSTARQAYDRIDAFASASAACGAVALLAVACAAVAGCSPQVDLYPRDVGNMAYPTPLPQGTVATTASLDRRPLDTGSMAYPDPAPQGSLVTTAVGGQRRQAFDTGNMAYPTPLPEGNVANTRVR